MTHNSGAPPAYSERATAALAPVQVDRDESVAILTLNRPATLNAIDREMALQLQQAIGAAGSSGWCRCLVITGAGRGFCSGQSLDSSSPDGLPLPSQIRSLIEERYLPLVLAMRELEMPVLAAVNGPAVGAGLSLALAADLRIVSSSAWFSCAFSRLGLIPDSGATFFLPRLVGPGRALQYALSGERISPKVALQVGLVTQIVPADSFEQGWRAYARELATGPTRAFAMTKRAFNSGLSSQLRAQLELEAELQQEACQTSDFREGLASFREKRPPKFLGR